METMPSKSALFVWLHLAARLPGRAALQMAVFIQSLSHTYERTTFLLLTPESLRAQGFTRASAYRALAALEQAGLITVRRQRGRSPLVSILDDELKGVAS